MNKKLTICIPYEVDFEHEKGVEMMMLRCHADHVNDLLKLYGTISLNEVLRSLYCTTRNTYSYRWGWDLSKAHCIVNEVLRPLYWTTRNTYSYRWGWDLSKGHCIEIKIISNPVNLKMVYLKITAYDIVD